MRTPRLTASLTVGLIAVAGLAGCRTSPNVAAYVGNEEVTVAELETAVDERRADPDLAAATEGRETEYTRSVLTQLVRGEIYAEAAQRYDIRVSDDEVQARLEELLEGQDPEALYAQAAAQGVSRTDILGTVREQIVRLRIAESEGLAAGLDEASLRARYEEVRDQLAQVRLGYITVPDQATANAVLAQLTTDPASYPALAAQYPSPVTLPTLEPRPADQVPSVLADQVARAAPNTGFTVEVPDVGGVVVAFVGEPAVPTFEEVRPDLEEEARTAVDDAAQELVADVRADLDITVNPRFGSIREGAIVEADSGVVDILDDGPPGS
ncbi:MAG TPA: SurA N-terminal domain-containing protein [Geodermatophilus sp.]|nr:SurA N-terminal domain-containing protein [Geodermatophilus sp.]